MKGFRLIFPLVLIGALGVYWWLRARPGAVGEAFASERNATLWSSLAQVRQPVGTLRYGERVAVLARKGDQVRVRTTQGASGWVDARMLMDPGLWQRRAKLIEQAAAIPAQARGHTKAVSNARIEPGRSALRVYQFTRGAAIEMVSRAVQELPASAEENQEDQNPRREDWFLVRGMSSSGASAANGRGVPAKTEKAMPVAGWVLARFVELDLPGAIRDYTSSAGMRVVAWFELNRVPDESGEKLQYLVAGTRGGEGQPCDFTLLRVYTWGSKRHRYETAYVESNLCGRLPIRVGKAAAGDPEFRFFAEGKGGSEERRYQMRQTVVRRVRDTARTVVRPRR